MTFRRSPHAIWRMTPSSLVVAVRPDPPVVVSGSGALVWRELAQHSTLGALVARLHQVVDEPPSHLADDVRRLVEELLGRGLLELGTEPTGDA